jgi:hypothetical protein
MTDDAGEDQRALAATVVDHVGVEVETLGRRGRCAVVGFLLDRFGRQERLVNPAPAVALVRPLVRLAVFFVISVPFPGVGFDAFLAGLVGRVERVGGTLYLTFAADHCPHRLRADDADRDAVAQSDPAKGLASSIDEEMSTCSRTSKI